MASDAAPTRFPADGVNPYLPTPVARVAESGEGTVTVATQAVRQATDFLDPYLDAPHTSAHPRRGRLLTLTGDFGTGKSHLAITLLRRAQTAAEPVPDTVYLDAPSGSFADLYRRFVSHLNRTSVVELLRDYYADIVADELGALAHTGRIADRLRAGEIDPVGVVQELALPDSELLQRQQRTLMRITGDSDLGTALTLMLEPAAQAVVWDWLGGNPPNEFLQERGIRRTISTDGPALAALTAVARLYLGRGRRFVLVIDEFDRVLSTVDGWGDSEDRLGPFKRLLESIGDSGAFVVLAGMSDMLRALDRGIRQRMGRVIEIPPMTPAEVRVFIQESHLSVRGDDHLDPFTPNAVDQLVALTKGVPRRFITLCHHLYSRAQQTQQMITPELVRQIGSTHYDLASVPDVRREVYQVLSRRGLRVSRGQRDQGGEPVVDYWVADSAGEFRCAILISGAVFSPADLNAVRRRVRMARTEAHDIEFVLVVVGYLTDQVAAELRRLTAGPDPVEYGSDSFAETLAAVVAGVLSRSAEATRADPQELVRDQMDRITRQQANIQELVEYVSQRLAGLGETTERQLVEIRREVAGIARGGGSGAADPRRPAADGGDRVLVTVQRLFDAALELLANIERMEDSLAAAFNPPSESPPGLPAGVRTVQGRLRQQEGFGPLGTAVFLQKLVEAFRDAFLDWYDSSETRRSGRPSRADRDRLDLLCTSYEALYHDIPVDELKKLVESTARYPDPGDGVQQWAWPTIRLDDVRRTFAELGVHVGRAVDGPPAGWDPATVR